MGWATNYIKDLQAGKTVSFRPRGNSMTGKIESGQLCTVVPISSDESIEVGDIVLCKVRGRQFLHLVKGVKESQVLIGNNRGHINGWTAAGSIYGKLTSVED